MFKKLISPIGNFNLLGRRYYSNITNHDISDTKTVRNFELENQEYKFRALDEKHNKVSQKTDEIKEDQDYYKFITFILYGAVAYIGIVSIGGVKDDIRSIKRDIKYNDQDIKSIEKKLYETNIKINKLT